MIKIELNYANPEDAARAMYRLAGLNDPDINAALAAPVNTEAQEEEADGVDADGKPKRRRRSKAEMEAARAAETPTEAPAEPVAEVPETPAAEVPIAPASTAAEPAHTQADYEAKIIGVARPALGLIMAAAGADVARKFLNDYGYQKAGEIPWEKIEDFAAKATAEATRLKEMM